MGDGFGVEADQLRAHAQKIEAIQARFGAVKSASANIAQDDQAYGVLCSWIPAVLEGRHTQQDELLAFVEENLAQAAQALRDTAEDYDRREAETGDDLRAAGGGL
ncbi:type VII secretion target [Saccharopolyspora sp. NPDC047091]|uniref:type VII secretion target n=1 Tax=Saccharopolyspora sp. NPDC047091 TaxID=3155924 RepID=UPI0033E3F515